MGFPLSENFFKLFSKSLKQIFPKCLKNSGESKKKGNLVWDERSWNPV